MRRCLGVVFQMTGIRQAGRKIRKLHVQIVHCHTVNNPGTVRGKDSLGGDGDSQDLLRSILAGFYKAQDLLCDPGVTVTSVTVGKGYGMGSHDLPIQIHCRNMKLIL